MFASSRLVYTDAELRQIADAIAQWSPLESDVPPLIRAVAVTPIQTRTWQLQSDDCTIGLQVTNVTRGTIQIPEIGWRLTSQAQPSTEDFRLIDGCSTTGASVCGPPSSGGSVVGCGWYVADIVLSPGAAGAGFLTKPIGVDANGSRCPTITLRSGQSIEVQLNVRSARAALYRLEPAIVVATAEGTMTVEVDRLAMNLDFADPKQFTCYQRHDHAYIEAVSGVAALVDTGSPVWCV